MSTKELWQTFLDDLHNGLVGTYEIEFNNGTTRTIVVEHAIFDIRGAPIYLCTPDGVNFPFFNVLSIKKAEN